MKKIKTFFLSLVPTTVGIGLEFALMFYFMILASILMAVLVPIITGSAPSADDMMELFNNTDFTTAVMATFSVCCTVIFGIWYYKSCGGDYRFSFKQDFHPLQLVGIVIMVPATQFATSLFISFVSVIFPKWLEDYNELMESAGVENASIIMLLYSVCLAPFSEELIFRGVTMRIARRAFPFWLANIIQAVLFGAFHMNMLQGCYAFALGLILGYVCERGGSIYYSILFHFLFNLWGMSSGWMENLSEDQQVILGLFILFGTFVLLPLGALVFRQGSNQRGIHSS